MGTMYMVQQQILERIPSQRQRQRQRQCRTVRVLLARWVSWARYRALLCRPVDGHTPGIRRVAYQNASQSNRKRWLGPGPVQGALSTMQAMLYLPEIGGNARPLLVPRTSQQAALSLAFRRGGGGLVGFVLCLPACSMVAFRKRIGLDTIVGHDSLCGVVNSRKDRSEGVGSWPVSVSHLEAIEAAYIVKRLEAFPPFFLPFASSSGTHGFRIWT